MLLITSLSDVSSRDVKYHVNVLEMFEACWAFVDTLWLYCRYVTKFCFVFDMISDVE